MVQDKHEEQDYWNKEAGKGAYTRYELGVYSSLRVKEYEAIVEGFFAAGEGKVVVDAGCGAGVSSIVATRNGYKVFGFDLSSALIEDAVGLASREGNGASPTFFVGDVENMALADRSCDICFFGGVLHHFAKDYSRVVEEAYRVLKPGGRLVALEPNLFNIPYRLSWYLVGRKEPHSPHEYPLSPIRVSRDLKSKFCDIRIDQFREDDIPFERQLGLFWRGRLGQIVRQLLVKLKNWLTPRISRGTFFIASARKPSVQALPAESRALPT